jgi:hypothetical protein
VLRVVILPYGAKPMLPEKHPAISIDAFSVIPLQGQR